MFNPNQNTGNPIATDTEWEVAQQTIYHDQARLSAVLLPVVRR
jgi:predicted acyl esterase